MRRQLLPLLLLALPAASAPAADLGGSRASMRHQNEIAKDNDFTFLRTPAQVRDFVEKERLVEVVPNADLIVHKVSFPYTRPIIKTFIERLAAQYRRATGEQLVVTSLTRPLSMQPRNASPLSVHPAGMAVDLRIPQTSAERKWLEETLLSLENGGLLDVTRERHPPHYHVAVFPERYETYVAKLIPRELEAAKAAAAAAAALAATTATANAAQASMQTASMGAGPGPAPVVLMAGAGSVLLIGLAATGLRLARDRRRTTEG